jgi:hypothetical protein
MLGQVSNVEIERSVERRKKKGENNAPSRKILAKYGQQAQAPGDQFSLQFIFFFLLFLSTRAMFSV